MYFLVVYPNFFRWATSSGSSGNDISAETDIGSAARKEFQAKQEAEIEFQGSPAEA